MKNFEFRNYVGTNIGNVHVTQPERTFDALNTNKLLETYKNEYGEIELLHENYNVYDDVKTIMYDVEDEHFKRQITISNRQMIDTCDTIICYVDKKRAPSGAKTAMNYAKRQGLKVVNLYDEQDEPTFGMTKKEREEYYKNLFKK